MTEVKRVLVRTFMLLVVAAALLALLAGCVIARGSGNVVDDERAASGFDRIEVRGSGELVVEQGTREQVTVRADDNLQRYIRTEVKGRTLVISIGSGSMPVSLWPSEPIRYIVRLKDLAGLVLSGSTEASADSLKAEELRIEVSGSGSVRMKDLDANQLTYELSGSGSATMSGSADDQSVRISGSGSYDAADLKSKRTTVDISGSASAEIWTEETLDIDLSGSGSIEYYGSPRVDQNVSGSGSVKGLGEK